jgi:hypothetical protein
MSNEIKKAKRANRIVGLDFRILVFLGRSDFDFRILSAPG